GGRVDPGDRDERAAAERETLEEVGVSLAGAERLRRPPRPPRRGARVAPARETREEVGVSLAGAERLGRLDDLHAGVRLVAPLVLSAFVYRLEARAAVTPTHEVAEALWVPVRTLLDPACHIGYRRGPTRWPGVLVGAPDRHVVWGLTYRLLESFFGILGTPFPARDS